MCILYFSKILYNLKGLMGKKAMISVSLKILEHKKSMREFGGYVLNG